jgi:putative transposase
VGQDRTVTRYCSRRRPVDGPLRARMRELAAQYRRYGYLRLHVLLRQEGLVVNRKRTYRLYRSEGLSVRKRLRRVCRSESACRSRCPIAPIIAGRWTS